MSLIRLYPVQYPVTAHIDGVYNTNLNDNTTAEHIQLAGDIDTLVSFSD